VTDVPLVLRIVSAFAVVGLALYAFALVSRNRMNSASFARSDRLVNVIETTPLAQNASLHVVKVGERYHLIAHTSGTVSLLAEIEAPVAERITAARRFPRALAFNPRGMPFGGREPRPRPEGSAVNKEASRERLEEPRDEHPAR
jgi:flagellar biogenesis protein FliO